MSAVQVNSLTLAANSEVLRYARVLGKGVSAEAGCTSSGLPILAACSMQQQRLRSPPALKCQQPWSPAYKCHQMGTGQRHPCKSARLLHVAKHCTPPAVPVQNQHPFQRRRHLVFM